MWFETWTSELRVKVYRSTSDSGLNGIDFRDQWDWRLGFIRCSNGEGFSESHCIL